MSRLYPSARGQKAAEIEHRPQKTNMIVTVTKSGVSVEKVWGPNYSFCMDKVHIELALDFSVTKGIEPLLWTYSKLENGDTEVKFGFDIAVKSLNKKKHKIEKVKIGHVALASTATISGEIYRSGAGWKINNDSGAWGNMGGHSGKTRMLEEAAQFMTRHCDMYVSPERAYSRYLLKRKFQQMLHNKGWR
jgi:hypothetical protein